MKLSTITSSFLCILLFGCESYPIQRHNQESYQLCVELHNKAYCDQKIAECHQFSADKPVCGIIDFGSVVEKAYQQHLQDKYRITNERTVEQ